VPAFPGESSSLRASRRPHPPRSAADSQGHLGLTEEHRCGAFARDSAAAQGEYAFVASRLAPEKGVHVAIDAARRAGRRLVVVADGPLRRALRDHARGTDVAFRDAVGPDGLARLRRGAAVALVPSRSAETFRLTAVHAMVDGVPEVASSIGGPPELVGGRAWCRPGMRLRSPVALERRWGDAEAGARGIERVRERCAPEVVAAQLAAVYDEAGAR
jgi:glycosyltransferase involved in cell wall biosynthesis